MICLWVWIILSSAVFLSSGSEGTVLFKKFIQQLTHPLDITGSPTWFLLYLSTEMVISLFHPETWAMTIATYKILVKFNFFHINCWIKCDWFLLREYKTLCLYNVIINYFKLDKCIAAPNLLPMYYYMNQVPRIFQLIFILHNMHFIHESHGKRLKLKSVGKMGLKYD